MFRASLCPSSGERYCLWLHVVFAWLCWLWLCGAGTKRWAQCESCYSGEHSVRVAIRLLHLTVSLHTVRVFLPHFFPSFLHFFMPCIFISVHSFLLHSSSHISPFLAIDIPSRLRFIQFLTASPSWRSFISSLFFILSTPLGHLLSWPLSNICHGLVYNTGCFRRTFRSRNKPTVIHLIKFRG